MRSIKTLKLAKSQQVSRLQRLHSFEWRVEEHVARHLGPPNKEACLFCFDTREGGPTNDSKTTLENDGHGIPSTALTTWANPAVYGSEGS